MRTYVRGCTTEMVAGVVGVVGLFLGTTTIWITSSPGCSATGAPLPGFGVNDLPKPMYWKISKSSISIRVMV